MELLNREDIIKVIEGKGHAKRVPLLYDLWIGQNMFDDSAEKWKTWQSQYPCDVDHIFVNMPGLTEGPKEDPNYFWAAPGVKVGGGKGLDTQCVIEDWEDEEAVEAFFDSFPDPDSPALIPGPKQKDGRYLLGRWWYCFFERL